MKLLHNTRDDGFTLIEVVVVVAIMGVLAMVAIPNMIGWRAERQVQGTARVFYSDLQNARITAIREAATVSVVVKEPSGDYSIFFDINGDGTLDAGDQLVKNVTTLSNITVQNVNFGGGNRTRFDSRGMAGFTGDLDYVNSSGDSVTITVNSLGRLWLQ